MRSRRNGSDKVSTTPPHSHRLPVHNNLARLEAFIPLHSKWLTDLIPCISPAGPFPKFTGFAVPANLIPAAPPASAPSSTLQPQQAPLAIQTTGNGVNTLVSQQERDRYSRLFAGSGPVNGLLDGMRRHTRSCFCPTY